MYVPEEIYFAFAIPATALYVAVMLSVGASVRQQAMLQGVPRGQFFTIGIILNLVATLGTLAAVRVGGGLAFLFFLVSQFRYVGGLYFLFSRNPLRLIFAALSCTQLFVTSLGVGMFHDLILWMAILFSYWFAQRRWPMAIKSLVLVMAAITLFSIQVVKAEYRDQLKKGRNPPSSA